MTMTTSSCALGILLSGRGSNYEAIQQAIQQGVITHAHIAVVISNRQDAKGLALARMSHLPCILLNAAAYSSRQDFDTAILRALKAHHVDLLVLAGYDRILGEPVLSAYPHRILNIHPSLLPAYGGKGMVGTRVHEAVLSSGDVQSGCSVHVVTETIDGGPVLGQRTVPVLPGDTAETLAARVLAEEHQLYPQVIQEFCRTQLLQST